MYALYLPLLSHMHPQSAVKIPTAVKLSSFASEGRVIFQGQWTAYIIVLCAKEQMQQVDY